MTYLEFPLSESPAETRSFAVADSAVAAHARNAVLRVVRLG
jgi:hypothetical protein